MDGEVLDFARREDLLYQVKLDLDKQIAGEDDKKLTLFMICCSSFTNNPLGAIITGESSAGKSWLLNQVLKYFPNVIEFTRITAAAPDRMQQNLQYKILKIEELYGWEQAQTSLRVLISEGRLRLLTVDPQTKQTTILETTGIPVFLTTTTNAQIDDELLNRIFMLSIDESPEQTKKVNLYTAESYSNPDWDEYVKPNEKILKFIELLSKPENPKKVVIPFSKDLAGIFPTSTVKARRDFKKLLNLIYVSAFIHQYQRPIFIPEGWEENKLLLNKCFVLALPQDFYVAWEITKKSFSETFLKCQARALKVLELFEENVEYTIDMLTAKFKEKYTVDLSRDRIRQIVKSLVNLGYICENDEKRPYKYFLAKKPEFGGIDQIQLVYQVLNQNNLNLSFSGYVETEILEHKPNFLENHGYKNNKLIHPVLGSEIQVSTSPDTFKSSLFPQEKPEFSCIQPVQPNLSFNQPKMTYKTIKENQPETQPSNFLDNPPSHWVKLGKGVCAICGREDELFLDREAVFGVCFECRKKQEAEG